MAHDNETIRKLFESLLAQGDMLTEVSPRDVDLPTHLRGMDTVVLSWTMKMAHIDDNAISGTLSFGGLPYWVCVSWDHVLKFGPAPGHPAFRKATAAKRKLPAGWRVIEGGKL